MAACLTILLASCHRPPELARLLRGVFAAIDRAQAPDRVHVLVVDDESDCDFSAILADHAGRENVTFTRQTATCGHAEPAFLSALDQVRSEFVWLLRNDDQIAPDGIDIVLRLLDANPGLGLLLLNPAMLNTSLMRRFTPIRATATTVAYDRADDVFLDFGFASSTTIFPCLVLRTAPVREFHQTHRLDTQATVYCHSFTLFGALRGLPALFLAPPVVTVTGPPDEPHTLQIQSPGGIMFYHQSLGLARLIRECARVTGVSIAHLGAACEDEIDRQSMQVVPAYLSHFVAYYLIEQLCSEQHNVLSPEPAFGHLSHAETHEIAAVIDGFGHDELSCLCAEAVDIFGWPDAPPAWKIDFLRRTQQRVRQSTLRISRDRECRLPGRGPRKVAMATFAASRLRGVDGGPHGRAAAVPDAADMIASAWA